jgi:DNA-binding LacI/PurR family transcriptional regulator
MLRVPLTTIDQGSRRIGECAATLLVERMGDKKPARPKSVLLPIELIPRQSTCRLLP